jgi:glutamate-ammonia-ligase adenylyltransferase
LGEAFTAVIDPLRYREQGLTEAEVVEIRRIKARVDSERLPRGADPATHLKLGRGGLADVEWTVQLLQLQHAGRDARLRGTSTLAALRASQQVGLTTEAEAAALVESWRLASKIRNAAMLVRGRPADSLPSALRDRRGVAFLCGYRSDETERLVNDYRRVTRRAAAVVRDTFWS